MQPSAASGPGPNLSSSPFGRESDWGGFPFGTQEWLPRPRLLLEVQSRWSRPLTAVVAGAGFGKTTLLAQAVRENRLARQGVDVSLRLEPADSSALHLASRVLTELGVDLPRFTQPDDLHELLVDVIWGRAPTAICLVLDDVHEVASGSTGLALLHHFVQSLPGNAHLLLGARTLPEVGVARLAVAGEALVLREEDLRFTDAEVAEFARFRGVEPERVAAANGWPALAELLARAVGVTTGEYIWEQVIGPLDPDRRERLVELAALGGADDELATTVAGHPVELAEALADVPLVSRSESGWCELHDVVADPIVARESAERLADIRRRGGIHARERGDADRALRLVVAAQAWDEVLASLRLSFVQLGAPEDPSLAAAWAEILPASLDGEPEVLLLQTVAKTVASPERSYELSQQAVTAFAARDDVEGEVAALARLGAVAYSLGDSGRIVPYVGRIAELARTGHPWAVAFDAVCRGALALMGGDWRQAEAILSPVLAGPVDPSQGLAAYFCARAQVEGGRFDEAARTLDRMPESHRERVRDGVLGIEVAVAQALGSGDAVLESLRAVAEARVDRRPLVARRVARSRLAAARAVLGDLDGARDQLMELELIGPPSDATIDEELMAAAAVAVVAGSEDEAAELLARVPDRGVWFPPLEGSTILYVLRPELRPRYDALDLEGVHAQRRAFAAAFVRARNGDLEAFGSYCWPREAIVRWFAPAPWLLEAAVYSAAAGGNPPVELLRRVGPSYRHVLRDLGSCSVPAVARTSSAFVSALPPAAPDPLEVRVLGTLEVDVGRERSSAPELRRERVRSLLGLLVVRRSVRRTEAAGVLWPELGGDQALRNLRVTLTHLLKLIEPRREKHASSYFIHQENERLTLRGDVLRVDAWEFEAAATEAEELERSGAPSLALEAHVRAVGFWRGELLADLDAADWLEFERVRLGTLFFRSALRSGELLAAHHELGHAIVMAQRAIAADPWAEAAYRLLASVQLERGDRSAARRVLEHLDRVLAQLGVEPGPDTVSLRRRCLESS